MAMDEPAVPVQDLAVLAAHDKDGSSIYDARRASVASERRSCGLLSRLVRG
jgi:hypothetical protein